MAPAAAKPKDDKAQTPPGPGDTEQQQTRQDPPDTAEALTPKHQAKPAAREDTDPPFRFEVPKDIQGREGMEILMDACERYGINPDPDLRPVELMAWRFYREDKLTGVPAYVQLVTGGGLKIRHYEDPDYPMDQDTETRLRRIFGAFSIDPQTKVEVPVALPPDLTLPSEAVDGTVRKRDHVYRGGYLRSGGAKEANRRAAEKKTRPKRK